MLEEAEEKGIEKGKIALARALLDIFKEITYV
jgi:hypothetical protein